MDNEYINEQGRRMNLNILMNMMKNEYNRMNEYINEQDEE